MRSSREEDRGQALPIRDTRVTALAGHATEADNASTMAADVDRRLQFGMLGPLQVSRGSELLRLGGERQRALLALMLVHANELVTVEQLVEALFGGQRSDGAANAVRVAVSRLRRLLEYDESGVLATRPGGYVLVVEPEQLDVARFERLLEDGRGLLSAGDAVSAAARLREALSLCRGVPLADLALVEALQVEIRRLEELRLLAVMERVDADLALGSGVELVAELEPLIASNPLVDRLRGQLMRALYRAGRQTDALAVYREFGDLLRGELGLEPGPALRELQRLILRQDGSLEAAAAVVSTRPVGKLPVPATPFLGRVREQEEVTALLWRADTRLLTLTGAGGSGKTRLALRIAQAHARDYSGGVWFVEFSSITDPDLIAPTICQTLELADQPGVTPARRLQEWLQERSTLLVLDNLEQLAASSAILGELLAGCAGLTLLVTSREPLHLAGEQQYEVPVLEPEDAIELFATRSRAVAPRTKVDSELAGRICDRLDRLPLAIELAAARGKALTPGELLSRLERHLPVLGTGPRDAPQRQRTLTATIDWSYDLLSEPEQRLFTRLAVFAGGLTLSAAESVCDAQLDTIEALADRSLLRADRGRYWMLQTLREYGLSRLERSGEAGELRRRHALWCVELLQSDVFPRFAPATSLLAAALTPERENFRAALEWALDNDERETVARLAAPLTRWLWFLQGERYEIERWLSATREHRTEFSPEVQAYVLSAECLLAWTRGEHEAGAAVCEQALAIYRELEDHEGICWETNNRGLFALERGDPAGARMALEDALQYAREHDVASFLPIALGNLGDFSIEEDRLDEARALCEEALALATGQATNGRETTACLINLAHIANLQGRLGDAATLGRRALTVALESADSLSAAEAVMEIAWPLAQQGQLERAGRMLGAAIGFHEQSGATTAPDGQGVRAADMQPRARPARRRSTPGAARWGTQHASRASRHRGVQRIIRTRRRVERLRCSQASRSARSLLCLARIASTASSPSARRRGGSGELIASRIAAAALSGSPGCEPSI